jgi:hypothetical protein
MMSASCLAGGRLALAGGRRRPAVDRTAHLNTESLLDVASLLATDWASGHCQGVVSASPGTDSSSASV